ncbi:histone-lysine N-methyltransferase SETD1B-like [Melanotaenia boesemani]|uniref:histone-lysine N-methyltransferase SETD1B-like n=1 Tax=Melanotaenia boesemani TaxID=1250792 RepID=UPI001C03FB14|nr:histone-lysine N-methyltransferase SETD1B-like [Melanotaenia boesemani]
MSATATRPPAHPGSDGGNPSSRTNSGGTNCAQQDPGQDPGSSSSSHPQHPAFGRPVFYIHAPPPPPPPFLQYQWPMPFSYNPFAGFPAMSYGMVVPPPPLPPPPFMEAPAYFLPHPHMQPFDYRRLLHPQVHTRGGSHQNSNQTHRIRTPHTVPFRATVNSEVQTEPVQRGASVYDAGWQAAGSDSGRGTASNSPASTGSVSQKRGYVGVVSYKLPTSDAKDSQVDEPCTSSTVKQGFDKYPPAVESCIRATQEIQMDKDMVDQEPPLIPLCRDVHMWVSSPDSVAPVCSSSQKEDEVFKERRISVPDILMGWGGDVPQAILKVTDGELLDEQQQTDNPEAEKHKSVYQSLTKNASDDGPMLFKILRLPWAFIGPFSDSKGDGDLTESTCRDEQCFSPNSSQMFLNVTGADPCEDTTEIIPYKVHLGSSQVRSLNESVWSVESLAPFIPTRDWLLQNGVFEPKMNEMMEEDEDVGLSTQLLKVTASACQERSCRLQPEMKSNDPETRPEQDTSPSEKESSSSPAPLEIEASPRAEEEKGSSEPEAHQSPNQESNELQEKSSLPEEETLLLNSAAEEMIQPVSQNGVNAEGYDRGPVTVQEKAEVSQSRGHLVDCGVQCNKIWEHKCFCEHLSCSVELNRKQPFKSDLKNANKSEAFSMSGNQQKRRNGQWRNRSQEQHDGQQEIHNGYFKPGKSKGGNGRKPRY